MLPKMQGPGYRQVYAVFYVITLCCCLSLSVQGRTLNSLRSLGAVSGPPHPARAGNIRLRRTLTDLQNILGTLERNRQSYEDALLSLDHPAVLVDDVGESGLAAGSPGSSRSLDGSHLWASLTDSSGTQKRGSRPCYWNVVSCYGK